MTHFAKGLWNAQCDRCGFWMKSDKLRNEWTGLKVCSKCHEPRNVQERVRGKADRQAPPWVRPAVDGPEITPENPVRPEDL